MSDKPISPLRERMLEDMNMRRFVPDTQREHIRAVKKLASFLGRSPRHRDGGRDVRVPTAIRGARFPPRARES
jgi:hypothetical protein